MDTIRYHLFMVTDLDRAPPELLWPDGITIRTYQDYPKVGAVYRAINEAFRDHWGYVEGEEEEQVEQGRHRIESDAGFDPSLWFLAMDGDDVAGMALCAPILGDDPEMGFVEKVGVARPWRRRGLALALLHHAFGEFHRRGQRRVSLGVDADSVTGATRLYEKAGMHADRQIAAYEIELRPGKELGTHSIEG